MEKVRVEKMALEWALIIGVGLLALYFVFPSFKTAVNNVLSGTAGIFANIGASGGGASVPFGGGAGGASSGIAGTQGGGAAVAYGGQTDTVTGTGSAAPFGVQQYMTPSAETPTSIPYSEEYSQKHGYIGMTNLMAYSPINQPVSLASKLPVMHGGGYNAV